MNGKLINFTLLLALMVNNLLDDLNDPGFVYTQASRKKGVVFKPYVNYEHFIEQYTSHNVQLLIKIYYYIYLVTTILMTTTIYDST